MKQTFIVLLLCPVAMGVVFLGELVGLIAIVVVAGTIYIRIMRFILMKLSDLMGMSFDEKSAYEFTIIVLLVVFGAFLPVSRHVVLSTATISEEAFSLALLLE